MPHIPPNSSLLSALSALVNAEQSARSKSSARTRAASEDDPRRQQLIKEFRARRKEPDRVRDLSSGDEIEKARARIRLAGERSPFNREAPLAGDQSRDIRPGQIIDIRV